MKRKKGQDSSERRKHERIPVVARVSRIEEGKNNFYFTRDLSVGGVYLKTDEEIPVGTILNLEISIQGIRDLLKMKGRVVRVDRTGNKIEGIGVQFTDLDGYSEKNIESLFNKGDED
jgi:uncharacterized protein (TIGR02266 family)